MSASCYDHLYSLTQPEFDWGKFLLLVLRNSSTGILKDIQSSFLDVLDQDDPKLFQ